VPLLAFTAGCARLGQGGGHYDRWLADNPDVTAVGLGWDGQLVEGLPLEPHDRLLRAVVTPTRLFERDGQ
jgi:5-formyltetrahydrofolate cyclo-ligase